MWPGDVGLGGNCEWPGGCRRRGKNEEVGLLTVSASERGRCFLDFFFGFFSVNIVSCGLCSAYRVCSRQGDEMAYEKREGNRRRKMEKN